MHERSLKNRYKPIVGEVAIISITISHEDHNCTDIARGKQTESSGQFIHRCLDMDEAQKHTREMSQPCEYDATPFNNYHYASQYSG